jgi:capsid protein
VRFDAKDIIAFHNLRDRAEQDVGFTELDASVQSLWRLFQYEKALTYAAIASCMKPFWIKKNLPTGINFAATTDEMASFLEKLQGGNDAGGGNNAADPNNPVQRNQGLKQRMSTETPGATLELDYGLELMQTDPKFPIEASHEFRQDNQRDIAVATGTSYQDISGDFQNLGFAAALMCQTPKQDYCKIRQRNFIDCVVRPIFREWLNQQILDGTIEQKYGVVLRKDELDQYLAAAKFKGKRWAFVNPLVQAQTLIIMLEAGIMSPQQVQDQLPDGVSIETLYTMIAEAKSEQEKHGLNFEDSDVTKPDVQKGVPGEVKPTPQEGGEQTPAKTKTGNPVRRRKKTDIAPATLALIEQQGDGTAQD